MGVIYILTNPSFKEYVKIGYANDIEKRLNQLNRSETIPYAFRVYAVYETENRLTDKELHRLIDNLNPDLRTIDNFDGKKRTKEFFAMSAEEAYTLLECIAKISGTEKKLKRMKPEGHEILDEQLADEIEQEAKEKLSAFSFDKCDIKSGEEIEFSCVSNKNSGIVCKVVDEKHVEYDGKTWSLSGLAKFLLGSKYPVAGPRYFKYKGEWLNDIRDRLGK